MLLFSLAFRSLNYIHVKSSQQSRLQLRFLEQQTIKSDFPHLSFSHCLEFGQTCSFKLHALFGSTERATRNSQARGCQALVPASWNRCSRQHKRAQQSEQTNACPYHWGQAGVERGTFSIRNNLSCEQSLFWQTLSILLNDIKTKQARKIMLKILFYERRGSLSAKK